LPILKLVLQADQILPYNPEFRGIHGSSSTELTQLVVMAEPKAGQKQSNPFKESLTQVRQSQRNERQVKLGFAKMKST
jgi:hypothetical protein